MVRMFRVFYLVRVYTEKKEKEQCQNLKVWLSDLVLEHVVVPERILSVLMWLRRLRLERLETAITLLTSYYIS